MDKHSDSDSDEDLSHPTEPSSAEEAEEVGSSAEFDRSSLSLKLNMEASDSYQETGWQEMPRPSELSSGSENEADLTKEDEPDVYTGYIPDFDRGVSPTVKPESPAENIESSTGDIKSRASEIESSAGEIESSTSKSKSPVVKIEGPICRKPYLGGYYSRVTGQRYHNASSQTPADLFYHKSSEQQTSTADVICRQTQTYEFVNLRTQTANDMSTQMTGIGIYVPNVTDRILVPGMYTTADEEAEFWLQQVITIQKYLRRWLAKLTMEDLVDKKTQLNDFHEELQHQQDEDRQKSIQKVYESRTNPQKTTDFDLLFNHLEKWRRKELEQINKTLTGAQRKAALCDLMDRQAELIHCLGQRRLEAAEKHYFENASSFLRKIDTPLCTKETKTCIDVADVVHAREFKQVFESLNLKDFTADERLDLLVTVKSILKVHPCSVATELEKLVDRESDLMARGFSGKGLEGLRRRISNLFLQYIKQPKVNPAVARFLRVPSDPMTLIGNTRICSSCHRYLPSSGFLLSASLRDTNQCRDCKRMDNRARGRKDHSIFNHMLKNLWRSEDRINDNARIAYLMQEKDLQYLIVYIWHCKSVISAHNDLYDLEILRWDKCEQWSPWNCILLTKEEALTHRKLDDFEEAYSKEFQCEVQQKHLLAKKHFHPILTMVKAMPDASNPLASTFEKMAKKTGYMELSNVSKLPPLQL